MGRSEGHPYVSTTDASGKEAMEANNNLSTTISNPLSSSLRPQEPLCRKSRGSNEAYRQRTCDSDLSHASQTPARLYRDSTSVTKARHPRNNLNCRPSLSLATHSQLLKQAANDSPLHLHRVHKALQISMTNPTSPIPHFPYPQTSPISQPPERQYQQIHQLP